MSVEVNELQDSVRRVMDASGLASAEAGIWGQIIELGWLLVSVPETLGGLEAGVQGACTMHMELGRGLSTAPYLPAMLAADVLCQSGLDERESWLERVIGGELITAPLAQCGIDSDGVTLSGIARGVQSADNASHLLLWSKNNSVVALVEFEQSGVDVVARPTWDETRRLFDVRLDQISLNGQTVIAEGEQAELLIRRLLAQRDFALAADAIGSAGALLELTVEHLQARTQFKRPLAMFQALKHRCADHKASIAAADAMLFDALAKVGDVLDTPVAEIRAAGAKLFATTMFARVAEDCLQLHGGIGMADEHPCHLFLKRALLSEQLSASNQSYAIEIAKDLLNLAK